MEKSKQYLKDNDILPRISFKDGKSHQVKLIKDEVDKLTDQQGIEKEGIKYKVLEDGESKTFFTSSIGLIQKLSQYPEGTEVVIQMKSKKGKTGKFISYFEARIVGEESDTEETMPEIDDIPIIE